MDVVQCSGNADNRYSCEGNGYGSLQNDNANYYGPYTTGYWEEYESFKNMAGFDGEVDSDGTSIYYDFEIMYENVAHSMVNGKVIYKSTAGADMYVVYADPDYMEGFNW